MKLIEGFVVSKVGDDYIGVATGKASKSFSGMIKSNSSAAFLLEKLQKDITADELVAAMLEEYDVDEDIARRDVDLFVEKLKNAGVLEI